MKGLMVSILRPADIGDCSNGGISSRARSVILVGEGIDEVFDADERTPAVRIIKRSLFGRTGRPEIVLHAEPVDGEGPWMAGGAFIASSDSRFGEALRVLGHSGYCAISLHDRTER